MTKKVTSLTFIDDGDDLLDAAVLKALKNAKKSKKKSKISKKEDKTFKKSYRNILSRLLIVIKGGPGSGHFGHAGRPGKRGGSLPGSGVGAALSVFTGRHARSRQWLRSQGLSRNDIDAIIASGAGNVGLTLVGHRGGLAQAMGALEVKPHIDDYKAGRIGRNTLIRQLGGDPLQLSLPGKIQKLGKFEQRIAQGKLQTGDLLQWEDPGMPTWLRGAEGNAIPYKVMEVDSSGWAYIEDPEGDGTWFTPAEIRRQFASENFRPLEGKFPSPVQHRINQGRLETGDIIKWNGEPWEVVPHRAGDDLIRDEWEVRYVGSKPLEGPQIGAIQRWELDEGNVQEWTGKTPSGPPEVVLQTPDRAWKPFPGAAADQDNTQLTMMREGDIEVLYYPKSGVSETYVGQLENGVEVLVKDSNPNYVGENNSEVVAYDLAHRLGYEGLVTPATIRPSTGEAVRVFAEGKSMHELKGLEQLSDYSSLVKQDDFTKMGILDAIMGATDRHHGNVVLSPDGNLVIIDNDFGFAGKGFLPSYGEITSVGKYLQKATQRWDDVTGARRLVYHADDLIRASALRFDSSFEDYIKSIKSDGEWDRTVERLVALEKFAIAKQNSEGVIVVERYDY